MPQVDRSIFENITDDWTAGQSLTSKLGYFVQMVSGGVFAAATAGQRGIIGVLRNAPASGEKCLIQTNGQVTVVSGCAITKGAALMTDANGAAITAAASAANHLYGYALEAASASGINFRMAFAYHGPVSNDL